MFFQVFWDPDSLISGYTAYHFLFSLFSMKTEFSEGGIFSKNGEPTLGAL